MESILESFDQNQPDNQLQMKIMQITLQDECAHDLVIGHNKKIANKHKCV